MTRRSWAVAAATLAAASVALLGGGSPLPTAVGDPVTVRLAAAGDFAANANTAAVLTSVAQLAPDALLALGDLSYGATGAEQAWCDFVTQRVGAGFPVELLAGNHESNGQNGNINDFSACLPNQLPGLVGTYGRQWYVDLPAEAPLVRLVMISPALPFPDGTWQYTAGSPRLAWTAAAIDGARAEAIPWVVVGMHKPCHSLGEYACDPGQALLDLLVSKRVDLVLSGHEHLYQRTAQLAHSPGCPSVPVGSVDPDCIADADDALVRGAGTVFATVGTGGQGQRAVHPDDPEAGYFVASSGLATATWGPLALDVTADRLTATFVRASGGSFADAFTVQAPDPGANQPPTASFTATCADLACAVDASASTDGDGTLTSYAWDFGDGATGSGATAEHTYASAGSRTIRLVVTDDDGATATTTRDVSPTVPSSALAADTFGRALVSGWGNAETGGAWRLTGTLTRYAVTGGAGTARFDGGVTLDMSLPAVSAPSTDLVVTLAMDRAPTGGGLYVSPSPRRVAGVGEYRAALRLRAGGALTLGIVRRLGTTETAVAAAITVPGLTYAAGDQLRVRVQAVGASPTQLRAKVWRAGAPEPSAWNVSGSDASAGLQAAGTTGLNVYLSSSSTEVPVVLRVDDVAVTAP